MNFQIPDVQVPDSSEYRTLKCLVFEFLSNLMMASGVRDRLFVHFGSGFQAMTVVYFDQLLGAARTQKLV